MPLFTHLFFGREAFLAPFPIARYNLTWRVPAKPFIPGIFPFAYHLFAFASWLLPRIAFMHLRRSQKEARGKKDYYFSVVPKTTDIFKDTEVVADYVFVLLWPWTTQKISVLQHEWQNPSSYGSLSNGFKGWVGDAGRRRRRIFNAGQIWAADERKHKSRKKEGVITERARIQPSKTVCFVVYVSVLFSKLSGVLFVTNSYGQILRELKARCWTSKMSSLLFHHKEELLSKTHFLLLHCSIHTFLDYYSETNLTSTPGAIFLSYSRV